MQCFVYASHRGLRIYLWWRERDPFDSIPAALTATLREPRLVLVVDLMADRQLPHEDAATVPAHLAEPGWHLPLPPAADLSSST